MQTILSLKQLIRKELSSIYPLGEINSFIYIIFEQVLSYKKIDTNINNKEIVNEESLKIIYKIVERLKNNEPIQYIFGETDFYDLEFKLNKDTLIPRPETEELVDLIIKENFNKNISILDIGTGSGCIAISLKKNLPISKVSAIDISSNAILMAKENAKRYNLELNFIEDDILNPSKKYPIYDIIVSNPPYIRNSEKRLMLNNVLEYEPHRALFVEDLDPLIFYREIAIFGKQHLSQNGIIYFEINENLSLETKNLLEDLGYNEISIIKDINDRDRIIKAKR
ncbi:peptide chain release factor N(5)-glutamine methyltransferase [Marinilabiliaceae bacterium JC040]|nr:peptide chain release factor N(5)-glutamine methyltransferase [Marinilabiliaceae bacterium JC040]